MIRWLIQTVVDHPDLSIGRPASGLLTLAELLQYEGYLSPRRRRDWLLGRWTTKNLAQAHVAATRGFCPALDDFSIGYDASGAPHLASQHPALRGTCKDRHMPLALSISHSNGYAFCALAENLTGKVRLGVDIELVEARPEGFAEEFFTATEQTNLLAAPPETRDLLTTATWSVKEASLKATHQALRANPRLVECFLHPVCPRHWTPVRVHMQPALRLQSRTIKPMRAWWRVIDNCLRPGTSFVLAITAFGVTL